MVYLIFKIPGGNAVPKEGDKLGAGIQFLKKT